ncbi:MAG: amidohydrolase [Alphaproteobacteria bacterium]|nr:amidohydrolase [Alphaproteobacteria bacterium]
MPFKILFLVTCSLSLFSQVYSQKKQTVIKSQQLEASDLQLKKQTMAFLEQRLPEDSVTAKKIWHYAEVGYKEVQSSNLHINNLKQAGFNVEEGVADIPTAFVATFGTGSPVIGILAEYDALPGINQDCVPFRSPISGKEAGHACGHNLFGTASVAVGIALKKLIEDKKISGTIKVYGCPAEEGGSGKVYLTRAGLFNNVDVVIHWHPGSSNGVTTTSALANKSAKFKFYGVSSHAAASPEQGRSSLDGVEAMDMMVNMMREHVQEKTRIHYVITEGGKAPNVIPDFAEVYYYVRHPKRSEVVKVFDRVVKAAEGAALGTETKMEYEIIGGTHDLLINKSLAELMQKNLEQIGGFKLTPQEIEFANKIRLTLHDTTRPVESCQNILPLKFTGEGGGGSTDVGDVSYTVPTVGLRTATWVAGTPAHSWQAVASDGYTIGYKGMLLASQAMALTAIDLFTQPTEIIKAKEEFKKELGTYKYKALLGDRKPALNYRD